MEGGEIIREAGRITPSDGRMIREGRRVILPALRNTNRGPEGSGDIRECSLPAGRVIRHAGRMIRSLRIVIPEGRFVFRESLFVFPECSVVIRCVPDQAPERASKVRMVQASLPSLRVAQRMRRPSVRTLTRP